MKECFVFRTHLDDPVHVDCIQDISKQISDKYDIIILFNSKKKDEIFDTWKYFTLFSSPKSTHKLATFDEESMKLQYKYYDGAWLHSQNGFVECYRQYPMYDQYWFCEYDVRFNGNWMDVLNSHQNRDEDLLGTHVESYEHSKEWWWWSHENNINLPMNLTSRYKYFPALSRLSNRFLSLLSDKIKISWAMVESYLPSICVNHFGTNSIGNLDQKFWDKETIRFRPIQANPSIYESQLKFNPKYKNKLIHPIK